MNKDENDLSNSQTIPPEGGRSKRPSPPRLDENNMPLPRRVDELDLGGTQVTPAAYHTHVSKPAGGGHPNTTPWRRELGCLLRGMILIVFLLIGLAFIVGALGIYEYYKIASTLPSVDDLRNRAAQFETTRILDRNGDLLYEILDPNAGRRTYVTLDKISPYLIAATIATEDKDFYSHPGFDPLALTRALWQNYTSGGIVSGASTITQQLARSLLLTPEERAERSYTRKAREIILAAEITRRYSKDKILELYLNEIYYGNLAYGIEAASETYFGTTADKLTLAQASFLAGLPQSPSIYDIYTNRDETIKRHQTVLVLMFQLSQEQGCIHVSNSTIPVCIDASNATSAATEIETHNFRPPNVNIRYPHWVNYIRSQLEEQYDAQTIYRSGFTIYTTLDPTLQDMAQQLVTNQVAALTDKHVTDGALVAIRPSTGEILAMVGSADFYNEAISGQVNMATSPTRQPGSSIKPINYTAAFEKGWTPATLIWDVPSEFPPSGNPNDPREPYVPVNYDERFHGPVTVRTALANSYNVPAVKTLQFVGIYDDPNTPETEGMIGMAKRLGITTLTRNDYGLSLTLGGGDVSLLEMTGAFAVFANKGKRIPSVAITKITDHEGKVVYEYSIPAGEQVIRPEHAFLISSILSDNNARAPMFGTNSVLALPFQVAAKTGTSNDFRDNWTLGYTPDLAIGVWVGNADYTPMQNTTGLSGAAPIWSQFMQAAIQQLTGGNPTPFVKPDGVIEKVICSVSGAEPSRWCPNQRSEYFAADQPPLPAKQDLWQKVVIDTWTGLESSSACDNFTDDILTMNVSDPFAKKWLTDTKEGRTWAKNAKFDQPIYFSPERECRADDPHATLNFVGLNDGQTINASSLDVTVIADATRGFGYYRLDFGAGDNPVGWSTLIDNIRSAANDPTKIYTWDLTTVSPGPVSLRLYMQGNDNLYAERIIHLNLQPPTPTPTPTEIPTAEPTFTPVPPTNTPTLTATGIPSATP
jgi:1A family penicillin-binding protein